MTTQGNFPDRSNYNLKMTSRKTTESNELKGPLSYKYILTSVDVYESIHHKIITC